MPTPRRSKIKRWAGPDGEMGRDLITTFETELLDRHHFVTRAQAEAACFDFIEGFYNPRRRHSTLGMLSPAAGYSRSVRPRSG
ncbi:hypothetical protein DI270_021780 [Microbispora triticiradicis]|uniref:Integrase catalytic domain-containing protein n=1 Tax=Microbispora triticiradicis TaxID=2200763 RepID=A0ABX9LGK1_9ACTN|nr:hypothetical protein DI270_021780 [Microbispora triticiradicis]